MACPPFFLPSSLPSRRIPHTICLPPILSSSLTPISNNTIHAPSCPPLPAFDTRSTLVDQLQPLANEYPHDPLASARRKPRLINKASLKQNRRFPTIDRWLPGQQGFSKAIRRLREAEESDEAVVAAFSTWEGSFSNRDVVAILNEEPSTRKAWAFFKWLKTNVTFFPNIYVYNVLLKVLRREGHWNAAMELMKEMEHSGVKPDNVTYSTIISFASRCSLAEALNWYKRMQEAGCTPDPVTYSTMINIYGQVGRMKEAFDIFAKLQREGVGFNNATCSTIIKLHGMQGDTDAVLNVYEEMKQRNVIPNVVTFNCILGALIKAGMVDHTFRVFKEMQSLGLKPSEVTLSLLVRAYGKAGMPESAFELFNLMKKEGIVADTVVYNNLLSLCAETGFVEEGEKILKELLQSAKHRPDAWTWNAVVEMYVKAGMMKEARLSFHNILDAGFVPETTVYSSLIQGYGNVNDIKSAAALFNEMVAAGLPVDELMVGTLLSLLSTCVEEEDSDLILRCIEKARPRLRRVVDLLVKEHVLSEVWKEEFRSLLNETPSRSQRVFCNLLINLCWARNLGDCSHQIMGWGISFGLYPDLQNKSFMEWCLNLHTLSVGAARTALQGWFSSLSSVLEHGGELPPMLVIEAGTGRGRTQETPMNMYVLSQLREMQAPFEGSNVRDGRYTATGEGVKTWLQSEKNPLSLARPLQDALSCT